jgi:arylsulfatase A-like enzyme
MVDQIENVLVFVCDSLRWGFLPDEVTSRGVTFKTVAQSTYSPPSFATLSTGLYPPEHGVEDFGKSLANGVETVYDVDELDSAYYNEGRIRDPFVQLFDFRRMYSLADLDPPFWYLERDPTTHAPYLENQFMDGIDIQSYFADPVDDWDPIKADYRDSIDTSLDKFERRLDVLEKLGLRDDTLVILTGDHGELFGEYGDMVHTMPTSPELVHVPTVFMHPSLSADSFTVDPDTDIIEHVDVVTTALAALGFEDALPTRGVNLRSEPRERAYGYSYTNNFFRGRSVYRTQSLWWRDSGYVSIENSR